MSEPSAEPPRVRVYLCDDAPARLRRWRQDQTGRWWAEVTFYVPASAVQQVEGENYSGVSRQTSGPTAEYVMVAPKVPPGETPKAEMHRADCWTVPRATTSTLLVTPMPSATAARGMLGFDDTTPCPECQPEP